MRLHYGYDALGRMVRAINADSTIAMQYEVLGQLVEESAEVGSKLSVVRHAYDELGNRVRTVLPDGRVLNNLFYGSGHLH